MNSEMMARLQDLERDVDTLLHNREHLTPAAFSERAVPLLFRVSDDVALAITLLDAARTTYTAGRVIAHD